jgi:excisionase family DNA binding protein
LKRKKRIELTIETERLLVVTRRKSASRARCSECAGQVKMVTADEAATLAGVNSRTVYRWIEEGKVHFLEPSDGLPLICLNSLYDLTASKGI